MGRETEIPGGGKRILQELMLHLVAWVVTVGVLVTGLRLDQADFHAPFTYDKDALLIYPFVQATLERGSHWRNERLGAPGIQELHDFPVVDHLHFGVIWILGRLFPDPAVVFNLFHLLTYPLAASAAIIVLRRLGLSAIASFVGGLLFAFQPYHYLRGEAHYFLSAYYMIPFTLLTALRVGGEKGPFFEPDASGILRFRLFRWGNLATFLMAGATASAGAYYAFFACVLLSAAGLFALFTTRSWKAAGSAAIPTGLIVIFGILNHAPTFPYEYENGHNSWPHARPAEDGERYGMKIAQLVLPVELHNSIGFGRTTLVNLAAIRSAYQSPNLKWEVNESEFDALGLVASLGYIGLLALACLPVQKTRIMAMAAFLTLAATLFATVGGFGALFNQLISPQVRCHNRLSIYIAFLAIFASCRAVDVRFDSRRQLRFVLFLAIAAFAFWDQTNDLWFPQLREAGAESYASQREKAAESWHADRVYFEQLEELQPAGMVYWYPFVEYPESPPIDEKDAAPTRIEAYDPVIGMIHTKTVRWNFGCMKGREVDSWSREVCGLAAGMNPNMAAFLERLTLAGFTGLIVDPRGMYPPRFEIVKGRLETLIGKVEPRFIHPDRTLLFFDLTGYRDTLIANYGKERWEAMRKADRERLQVMWFGEFRSHEDNGLEHVCRVCGRKGDILFVNNSDHDVTYELSTEFRTTDYFQANLTITGEVWSDQIEIGPGRKRKEIRTNRPQRNYHRLLTIPPGRHKVRFRCDPLRSILPHDSANELFRVIDWNLRPVAK